MDRCELALQLTLMSRNPQQAGAGTNSQCYPRVPSLLQTRSKCPRIEVARVCEFVSSSGLLFSILLPIFLSFSSLDMGAYHLSEQTDLESYTNTVPFQRGRRGQTMREKGVFEIRTAALVPYKGVLGHPPGKVSKLRYPRKCDFRHPEAKSVCIISLIKFRGFDQTFPKITVQIWLSTEISGIFC